MKINTSFNVQIGSILRYNGTSGRAIDALVVAIDGNRIQCKGKSQPWLLLDGIGGTMIRGADGNNHIGNLEEVFQP